MTDERLRQLERAFKESGSPEDELAWLQQRVRQGESLDWESYSRLAELNVEAASEYLLARVERGELEREKLELAAYCSHEPARVASASTLPSEPYLKNWIYRLHQLFGSDPVSRASATVARFLLPFWEMQFPTDLRPRHAVEAAWLRLSSTTRKDDQSAEYAGAQAAEAAEAARSTSVASACEAIRGLTDGGRRAPGVVLHQLGMAARNATLPVSDPPVNVAVSVAQAGALLGEVGVRRAITDELVAWALAGDTPASPRSRHGE